MRPPHVITDADSAHRLFASLARAADEVAAVAYLDPKWRLIGLRHTAGSRGRTRPSIRAIVRDALSLGAGALVIAHNHPSGDATPSCEDIAFTRDLARTLHALDLTLGDHLIIAAGGWTSLRALGLC